MTGLTSFARQKWMNLLVSHLWDFNALRISRNCFAVILRLLQCESIAANKKMNPSVARTASA
jgi:hypothetical protein